MSPALAPPARILLVEPAAAARRDLELLLTRLGHQVVATARAAGPLPADLVVLGPGGAPGDPTPPGATRLAVCAPEAAEAWLAVGVEDVVSPPLSPRVVGRRIAACLAAAAEVEAGRRLEGAQERAAALLESVVQIGVMLCEARDFERLLEEILRQAQACGNADAGTLYVCAQGELRFHLLRTTSLGLALGGVCEAPVTLPPLPLRDPATGVPNLRHIATYAALTGETVNLPDAYEAVGFDFSGTREFDRRTGYRSRSTSSLRASTCCSGWRRAG